MNYQDPSINDFITNPPPSKRPSLGRGIGLRILIIIFSLIIIGLILAMLLIANKKASVSDELQTELYQSGRTAGRDEARKEYKDKLESEFQTYTSPEEYGKFTITFPKYWSYYIEESESGDPIKGLASPNGVHQGRDKYALKFDLFDKKFGEYSALLKTKAKDKKDCSAGAKICVESIKISGIEAQKYTGDINEDGGKAIAIIAPLRDKTFFISTDIPELYEASFNLIVEKVKLNP